MFLFTTRRKINISYSTVDKKTCYFLVKKHVKKVSNANLKDKKVSHEIQRK